MISTQDIVNAQKDDEELQLILQSDSALNLKKLRVDDSDDIVYCDITTSDIRPYIPKSLRRHIFNTVHGFSHPSGRSTKKLIQKRFVWPNMTKDITEWALLSMSTQQNFKTRALQDSAHSGSIYTLQAYPHRHSRTFN